MGGTSRVARHRIGRASRAALAPLVAMLLAACSASAPSTSPTPEGPVGTASPGEAQAVEFRISVGLRADIPYVREVAANPIASSREFAIPLLPAEIAVLNSRAANAEAVVEAIGTYADAHPGEFAGLYLDQQRGGAVTTLWTNHLEAHEAEIRALVFPGARLAFRGAEFTYRELTALQERISSDWDWMRGFGMAPLSVGVDVIANRVQLDVSTVRGDAADLIVAHYPGSRNKLKVTSDGTGAALLPRGTVRGRAVDALGQPPGEALAGQLTLTWTSDGPGDCGAGDMGYGLNGDGTFELPCQQGGHTISVQIQDPNGTWQTIGSGHVAAIGGATVEMTIRLVGSWPPAAP